MSLELTDIGYWKYDPATDPWNPTQIAAGNEWRPSAQFGKGELDSNEVAEVLFPYIEPPIKADGTEENLEVSFVIDEQPIKKYININGTHSRLMCPNPNKIVHGERYDFGKPIREALASNYPPFASTTLKVRYSIRPVVKAGAGGITRPFSIRLVGFKYKAEELDKILDKKVLDFPAIPAVSDRGRERALYINKPAIPVNVDNWQRLPGGVFQDKPIIMPYMRYATNAKATTINSEYRFRFETGEVGYEEQDLYWPFDQRKEAILLTHLGVRYAPNLKYIWIALTGDKYHKEHPKGYLLIPSAEENPQHFGVASPVLPIASTDTVNVVSGTPSTVTPAALKAYFGLPRIFGGSILLYNEICYVAMQDNGTSISANAVTIAVAGISVEM